MQLDSNDIKGNIWSKDSGTSSKLDDTCGKHIFILPSLLHLSLLAGLIHVVIHLSEFFFRFAKSQVTDCSLVTYGNTSMGCRLMHLNLEIL